MTVQQINKLLNKRDSLLDKDYNNKEADVIQKQITNVIRKNFNDFPVDFIIETWTRFGSSLNIVYDDNGLFAVTYDGYAPVVTGKQKIQGTISIYVEKHMWKKTIREALYYFLFAKPRKLTKKEKEQGEKFNKVFDEMFKNIK